MKYLKLYLFHFIIFIGVSSGQESDVSDLKSVDQFAKYAEKNDLLISSKIDEIRMQKDPVIRFMMCVRHIIEINKFLSSPENLGEFSSVLSDEPAILEEREARIAEAIKNKEKLELALVKGDLKKALLEEMQKDLSKIETKYQDPFGSVLKSLR